MTLLAPLLLLAHSASAESTQVLLSSCKSLSEVKVNDNATFKMPQDFDTGRCWGAFAVMQKVINITISSEEPALGVCAPETSSRTQLIAIFVDYARRHPSRYHEDFFLVALDALQAAFPCEGVQKPK
jgi:hypothetical protein